MMMERLTSRFQVDLLIRMANSEGGFAMVLHKGDEHGGAIIVQCRDRGDSGPLMERRWTMNGQILWEQVGPSGQVVEDEQRSYIEKRLCGDPDLWVVELDIANAEHLIPRWLSNA